MRQNQTKTYSNFTISTKQVSTRVKGERPHGCVHCGKTFAHKHCLNTHLLLHSTDRPYQCNECKKSFTLKHHLLTHSRVSHFYFIFVVNFLSRKFITSTKILLLLIYMFVFGVFVCVRFILGSQSRTTVCMSRVRPIVPVKKTPSYAQ